MKVNVTKFKTRYLENMLLVLSTVWKSYIHLWSSPLTAPVPSCSATVSKCVQWKAQPSLTGSDKSTQEEIIYLHSPEEIRRIPKNIFILKNVELKNKKYWY